MAFAFLFIFINKSGQKRQKNGEKAIDKALF